MRYWTVDQANQALPRVTAIVERAREAAGRLREKQEGRAGVARGDGHVEQADEMEPFRAAVAELAAEGIVLRDAEQGLVDFPAVTDSGKEYWLCWLLGEAHVDWWHWPEDGFAGRAPLSEPPR